MGFRVGSWAKIWEVTPGDRSTKVRLSISKKNKKTDKYEEDFAGYVTLAGTAHRDAANLKAGDRIKIGECDVTNRYDKEKKVTYTNFSVYTYEIGDGANAKSAAAVSSEDDSDDGDLPF